MTDWRKATIADDGTHHVVAGRPLYESRFASVLKYHTPGLAPALDESGAYHIDPAGSPALLAVIDEVGKKGSAAFAASLILVPVGAVRIEPCALCRRDDIILKRQSPRELRRREAAVLGEDSLEKLGRL